MTQPSPTSLKIKLYSDGADRASMLEMAARSDIQGLTTNPSLMRKAGVTDYRAFCKDILAQIKTKPISFEVFADEAGEMERQAREIATWGANVYVKIPIMNSEGKSSLDLIQRLSHANVKVNVTALMTISQVEETCAAVKGGAPSIVSVFAGRIADTGRDPMPMMKASVEICRRTDKKIELLWASTREVYNLFQAEQCGCDIITVPFDILKKREGLGKDLTELSLDTVRTFKKDAEAAGFKL